MLITSFQSNCVPGVSSVSEDIDNFRRNRSRGCGFVQNCLKSLIIKDKHLWNRMWKPSTFMRENLKFIHRWLKVIHKPFRKDQLSTARPHGFHYCGLIFFFSISMVFLNVSSFDMSPVIFSAPCMMVVWSLPPR